MKIPALLFALLLSFQGYPQQQPVPKTLEPGSKAINFRLKGIDGKEYSLDSFRDARILAIVFSAPHCPTAQAYEDRIIALQDAYPEQHVRIVMINPNNPDAVCLEEMGYTDLGDSFDELVIRAKDKGYNFTCLYDGDTQETSIAYGPVSTPHVFIFDENRILRYTGRIDDNEKIGSAKQHDMKNAIESLLAGKEVALKQTKTFGCSIKWKWKNDLRKRVDATWAKREIPLESLPVNELKVLMKNNSDKLRLVNVWATWCGPCVAEFDYLIDTYRMYMGRDFEMYTISTDNPEKKQKVQEFLQAKHAALTGNYIFESTNRNELLDNLDPRWQGAIPYTVLIEPGGKIVYRSSGEINLNELRKAIVENRLIGRYY